MRFSFIQRFTRFFTRLATMMLLASLLVLPQVAYAEQNPAKPRLPQVPPLSYMNSLGDVKKIDVSKTKLAVIHFWATWCQPCIEEFPKLNEAQRKFSSDGFKVFALSLDMTNVQKVKEFYAKAGINAIPIMMDANLSAFKALKLRGLPSSIFVNNKMEELARYERSVDWQSKEVEDFITAQIWGLSN